MVALRIVVSLILWVPVIILKVLLVILGLVLVPVLMTLKKDLPKIYRGVPATMWNQTIRNPVGGFGWLLKHPPSSKQFGLLSEPTPDGPHFQWRFRLAGVTSSLRLAWRYSRTRYGELYLGWKIDSAPPEFDFALSLRPWATIGN